MAEHQLKHLRRRLVREPDHRKKCSKFIEDLQARNYTEKIPSEQIDSESGVVWYLPLHSVTHPKKPDKVRVVFDCAAKYHGTSLNNNVLQGPDLTNSLIGVLLRFRQEPVAVMTDVEAMFHQVLVHPKDIDALRFLWYPDGDLDKEPEEFRMLVHLLSGVWSSSSAGFALRKIAVDHAEKFEADVIKTVQCNFYVDDILKSLKTSNDAVMMYEKLTELLTLGGFHLTKWISNKREILEEIPDSELTKELKSIDLGMDEQPVERALGMQWNVELDKFQYRIIPKNKQFTRIGILSIVSSIYDLVGFVSLSPMKPITMPRLELSAAKVAVNLDKKMRTAKGP